MENKNNNFQKGEKNHSCFSSIGDRMNSRSIAMYICKIIEY